MTNEKTNPMPYRAADAAALLAAGAASGPAGPDMAAPAITPDDVARGTELLRRYKDGKRALEARIIADEIRYLCQSDPIAPRPVVQRTPKVFDPLSSN